MCVMITKRGLHVVNLFLSIMITKCVRHVVDFFVCIVIAKSALHVVDCFCVYCVRQNTDFSMGMKLHMRAFQNIKKLL